MSKETSNSASKSTAPNVNVLKGKASKQVAKLPVPPKLEGEIELALAAKKLAAEKEKPEADDELQDKVEQWLNASEEVAPQATILFAQAGGSSAGMPVTATDAGGGGGGSAAVSLEQKTASTPIPDAAAQPASSLLGGYGWVAALGALAVLTKGSTPDTTAPDAPKINAVGASNVINAAAKAAGVTISGTAEANATVSVVWGTATATATTNASGVWTTTVSGSSVPADGNTNIVASAKDAAGNKSIEATLAVKVDTQSPTAPSINTVSSDNIVSGSEKTAGVVVSGTTEAGASVAVTWGAVVKTVTANSSGVWTSTFAAADIPADAASTSISAVATDSVGNASSAGTKTVAIDSTAPTAAVVSSVATDNTVNAAEKAAGVVVSGTAEAGSSVAVTWGTVVKTVTANSSGAWTTTFAAADVPADATSTSISAFTTDTVGNVGVAGTKAVVVDTVAPAVSAIGSVATDNTVNATEKAAGVVVTGAAEAGASVAVTWGTVVKTVTANSSGAWTTTFATADVPADAASTSISAVATDIAGNVGSAASKEVAVDTLLPQTPQINAVASDNRVNTAEKSAGVTVTGTSEAGLSVAVTWGAVVKTVTANSAGLWTCSFESSEVPADSDSTSINAVATNSVGNASAAGTRTVTVDSAAPAAPAVSTVATDNTVNAAEKTAGVVVSGTAEANASVAVTWGTVVKTVTADSSGAWTSTFAAADVPADAASTSISAVATDAAGNASSAGTRTVAVDTSTPAAPAVSAVATDNKVNATEKTAGVVVSGTAEANATVAVTWGTVVKTVTANSSGAWSTTFAAADVPADAASTSISAVATDAAGNASTAGTRTVTVDTALPTITVLTANSADKTITLTYSEALNTTDLPATSAFNVSIAGVANPVSSVAVNGSTMVLTLTNAFSAGAVSVVYTDPSTGNDTAAIQDLAGNDAASFTNTVVADGYIRGATVYIDVNQNGVIDVGTDYLVGTTDANGNVLIPGGAPAGSIIATGGVNTDTGAPNTMVLKAPQGAATINPLTTLVQAVIEKAVAANPNTVVNAALIAQASTKVADSLGLTSSLGGASLLNYDPIAKGDTVVQKAAAQVATIVTLAGNAEAGITVISKLTDVINTQTTGAPAISLTNAATLTSVLPTNTSDAVKTAISSATTSISTAASLDAITNAQSAAIDKTAPDAPKSVEFTAVTKIAQPKIKISFDATMSDGTALIAGDTLTVKDGTTVLGNLIVLTAADIAKGFVEMTSPTLSEGAHTITASFVDKAGNISAASSAKTLTVDLTAPIKPSVTAFSVNSGSTQDTITNDATPTITISAETGSTVEVFSGTTLLGKATETSSAGVFSFTTATLNDGSYSLTAKSTDAAGNNNTSNAQAVTVDTVKPTTPSIVNAVEGSSAVTLTIMGEAGSKVDVYSGTTKLGSAVESSTVAGQFSYAGSLVNSGKYSFSAKASDTAGNASTDGAVQSIIFAAGQSFQTVTPGSVEVKLISSDATKATFGIYATGTFAAIDAIGFVIPIDITKVTYDTTSGSTKLWSEFTGLVTYSSGNGILIEAYVADPNNLGLTDKSVSLVNFSLNWVSQPTTVNMTVNVGVLGERNTNLSDASFKFVPGNSGTVVGADDVSDLFLIGSGQVTMTGGKGADIFALTSTSNSTLNITDFVAGSDTIDVSRFLTSVGYTGTKSSGAIAANVALLKALSLSDLSLVAGNSSTLDNVAGYFFEAATSGTNKGTLHLIFDKDAATGTGHVNLVQISIVLGAGSTGFSVADLITVPPGIPVI